MRNKRTKVRIFQPFPSLNMYVKVHVCWIILCTLHVHTRFITCNNCTCILSIWCLVMFSQCTCMWLYVLVRDMYSCILNVWCSVMSLTSMYMYVTVCTCTWHVQLYTECLMFSDGPDVNVHVCDCMYLYMTCTVVYWVFDVQWWPWIYWHSLLHVYTCTCTLFIF